MTDVGGRDFDRELRAEESLRQAEGITGGARRSVWGRLERTTASAHRPQRSRRWAMALAGAAAVVALAVAVTVLRPAPGRLADLDVARRSTDLATRVEVGLVSIERGTATLVDRPSGLSIETVGPVALRREGHGVRLVRGRIEVTAAHRSAAAAPATVIVSHGAIEVVGTAFTVVQEGTGGRVALREGNIRFRGQDGTVVSVRPGEELAWPLPPTAPPTVPPPTTPPPATQPAPGPAPRSASAAARPAAGEALLDHVEELRSRHQYEEAARALRRALPLQPNPMREQLSFELGSLLTHQIRDARRACAQWAWHARHFPDGRYGHEVARARAALACRGHAEGP